MNPEMIESDITQPEDEYSTSPLLLGHVSCVFV